MERNQSGRNVSIIVASRNEHGTDLCIQLGLRRLQDEAHTTTASTSSPFAFSMSLAVKHLQFFISQFLDHFHYFELEYFASPLSSQM